jgi:hypothetical protein
MKSVVMAIHKRYKYVYITTKASMYIVPVKIVVPCSHGHHITDGLVGEKLAVVWSKVSFRGFPQWEGNRKVLK